MAITEKILFAFPNMRAHRFWAIPSLFLFSACTSSASSCREEPRFADPLSSVSSSFQLVYFSKGCKGGKCGSLKQKALCNQTERKHLISCFQLYAYRRREPNIDRGKEGKEEVAKSTKSTKKIKESFLRWNDFSETNNKVTCCPMKLSKLYIGWWRSPVTLSVS